MSKSLELWLRKTELALSRLKPIRLMLEQKRELA
jgi:hypothetical protein